MSDLPTSPAPDPDSERARTGPPLWKRALRRFFSTSVLCVMKVFFLLRVENRPKLDGPFILAPNHTSFLDPALLQCIFPRHITFVIDDRIYRMRALNWLYRLWNALPVVAGGSAIAAMKGALLAVKRGEVVGIFPEGRIADDGKLQEGMAGIAVLMQRTRVPIVPVAIIGAYRVLPRHAAFPRPGRLKVVFGEPIPPDADAASRDHAATMKRVMDAIAELLRAHGAA